jgi:predicted signal transduction protein with EAL and GGDEF domain
MLLPVLLRNADTAMYQAKEEGRNTYRFYTQEMMAITFERMLLENALRQASRTSGISPGLSAPGQLCKRGSW